MRDLLIARNGLVLVVVLMLVGIKFNWGPAKFAGPSRKFLEHNSSGHAGASHALLHSLVAPPPQSDPPNAAVLFEPSNSERGASVFPTQDVSVFSPSGGNLRVMFLGKMATALGDGHGGLVVPAIPPTLGQTQTSQYQPECEY